MKKSLLALAVLGAFASAASAQSSVTLSGTIDAGVIRRGGGTNAAPTYDWLMAPSQSNYSSFTLSGAEDMGGGMFAYFGLNHRFRIQNGATRGTTNGGATDPENSTTFWRRSFVGLRGAFGDLRLGRQDMPLQDMNGGFDVWSTGTVGSTHTGGVNATVRANNAIYYRSPVMGGLSVHAAIAAGEGQTINEIGTGNSAPGISYPGSRIALLNSERPAGFNVRYAAGPLNVGVAYDRNTTKQKTVGVYGSYDFGTFKLSSQFEKGDNCTNTVTTCATNAVRAADGVVTTAGKDDVKVFSISAQMPLGAVLARVGYVRVDSKLANGDGSKFGVGGDYSLSKRTNLYADFGKRMGDRYSIPDKRAQFDLGITHRF